LQNYKSVWTGLFILILVWTGLLLNAYRGIDQWLYQQEIVSTLNPHNIPSSVVVVEARQSFFYASYEEWLDVLVKLNLLEPRAIVMPSRPSTWSELQTKKLITEYPLFLGKTLSNTQETMNDEYHAGLTLLPPIVGKTYPQQWLTYEVNGREYDSLEASVAKKLVGSQFKKDRFFVDFRYAKGRVPVVEMERVKNNEMISSLIKNQVVLIGFMDSLTPELLTSAGNLSFSTFQAYALDTLLNQRSIVFITLPNLLVLSFLFVISLMVLIPRIADRYQIVTLILIMMAITFSSWLLLMNWGIWISPAIFLIAEIVIFLTLYYQRHNHNKVMLREMALNSAHSMESRWMPQNFFMTDEHWTQIANMVSQTLSLNRTIFLEKIEDDHRVREVKAIYCSLADVHEMRRDYFRAPYTTAMELGGILRLQKEYLTNASEPEIQYLAPLVFAGEVQGFWAFTVNQNNWANEKKMLYAVSQFMAQISEMLFHRSQWLNHQATATNPITKVLNMQFDEPAYSAIHRTIQFMNQRLSVMESVLNGMKTSAVLYDVFGRVVQVNEPMVEILSAVNIATQTMTASELMSQLTECSLTESRAYINYVIVDKGTVNLPVNHKGLPQGYMLSVKGIRNEREHGLREAEVRPFELLGILCEMVDMSHIREVFQQKEQVIEHLNTWLRNDLSCITMACDLVKDQRVKPEKKGEMLSLIKEKVAALENNILKVSQIIQTDLASQASAKYPVECMKYLTYAIDRIEQENLRSVIIEQMTPYFSPLVMAAPTELQSIFDTLMNLLYKDTVENGKIAIKVCANKGKVEFEFANEGFGIPNEHLQFYLNSDELLDSDDFKALRTIKLQIEKWGGELVAKSAVGEGMIFTFNLEAFSENESVT